MKLWKSVAAGAVLGTAASGAAIADWSLQQEHRLFNDPSARAYLSIGFDRPPESVRPMHFGLRFDGNNLRDWYDRPAVAQIDFDRAGLTAATMNGMPLLQRDHALYADEGELVYGPIDWGVLALGALALGYIVYEIADSDSGSAPERAPEDDDNDNGNGNGGGLLGGLLGGLGGLLGLQAEPSAAEHALGTRSYREWRDGGTGQMGDLD